MFNFPSSATYVWTKHAQAKMAYYRISPSRVRRIIKSFLRVEEGIAPDTVAFMQPVSYKTKNGVRTWNQEYWVMAVAQSADKRPTTHNSRLKISMKNGNRKLSVVSCQLKVISAWRYPGRTKPGAPLPEEILSEVSQALRAF